MATSTVFASLPSSEQQRLLNKLAKLKALSECQTGNVNETATAAAAMTRLMIEYQIEVADFQLEDSSDSQVTEEDVSARVSRRGFPAWQVHLLSALANVNNCISYTSCETHYFFYSRETHSRLRLIGSPSDISNTRQLFVYCIQEIEHLCGRWGARLSVARKNDFRSGAAHGIGDRVEQERAAVVAEELARAAEKGQTSRAIACFDSKMVAVRDRAEEIGIYFSSRSSRGVSKQAFAAGYKAGSALELSPNPRKALPSS